MFAMIPVSTERNVEESQDSQGFASLSVKEVIRKWRRFIQKWCAELWQGPQVIITFAHRHYKEHWPCHIAYLQP